MRLPALALAVLGFAAVLLAPGAVLAEEATWSGTWKVTFVKAQGEEMALGSRVLVLEQNGERVTGTWKDARFHGKVDGKVSGKSLKAKTTSSGPEPRFALDVKLSADGTKFSGVWLDAKGNASGEAVVAGRRAE